MERIHPGEADDGNPAGCPRAVPCLLSVHGDCVEAEMRPSVGGICTADRSPRFFFIDVIELQVTRRSSVALERLLLNADLNCTATDLRWTVGLHRTALEAVVVVADNQRHNKQRLHEIPLLNTKAGLHISNEAKTSNECSTSKP